MTLFNPRSLRLAIHHLSLRGGRARAIAGIGVFLVAVAAAPSVPLAVRCHIGLASSVPAKDSHVTAPLREIRLTFTGPINVTKAGVELVSADGKNVPLDSLRAVPDSARVAVARVAGTLAQGMYTVRSNAIAADGSAGKGSFNFMYMPAPEK